MSKVCKLLKLVQTVRSVSSPRCRSEAQATLLVAVAVVNSEAGASRAGEAVSPSGLAVKRPRFTERSRPIRQRIGRHKQGSLR